MWWCLIVLASSCRSLRHAERAPMIGGLKRRRISGKGNFRSSSLELCDRKGRFEPECRRGRIRNYRLQWRKEKPLSVTPLLGIESGIKILQTVFWPCRPNGSMWKFLLMSWIGWPIWIWVLMCCSLCFWTKSFCRVRKPLRCPICIVPDDIRRRPCSVESKDTKTGSRFRTTADKRMAQKLLWPCLALHYALNWTYGDFGKLGAYFSSAYIGRVAGTGKTYSLDMKLSRMSVGETGRRGQVCPQI